MPTSLPTSLPDALARLCGLATAIQPLPDADWDAFAALWAPVQLPRKALITAAGGPEPYLYFVTEGVQRLSQCCLTPAPSKATC